MLAQKVQKAVKRRGRAEGRRAREWGQRVRDFVTSGTARDSEKHKSCNKQEKRREATAAAVAVAAEAELVQQDSKAAKCTVPGNTYA